MNRRHEGKIAIISGAASGIGQASAVRLAEEGFHAPLDLVDGAARVYDPVVRGEAGDDVFGVFLKDYKVSAW